MDLQAGFCASLVVAGTVILGSSLLRPLRIGRNVNFAYFALFETFVSSNILQEWTSFLG